MRHVKAARISANSLCGYKSASEISDSCQTCSAHSDSATCASCVDDRVRCFDDCDPLLMSGECTASAAPSNPELCRLCGIGERSLEEQPAEGGRQFKYLGDDRVIEYVFINNSTQPLTVGSGPNTFYPFDPLTLDTNVLLSGAARSALCYRGRFYWQ